MRSKAAGIVVVLIGILASRGADAQITQGRLNGLVTDSQGAVLPGVTVTATSPSLIGMQSTVTQADGRFLFPALPSGTYRLVFELSGFQKLTRENVPGVTGQTISLDAQLPIAALAERVTVTGASPIRAVTRIKSGGNTFKGLEHLSDEPGKFVGSNGAASDISSRGYPCPNNSLGQPQCNNPVLLFYEGHTDLGGPIKTDRVWFYGAYNHFKINKAVAGVAQSVATDLGIFDNETAKATAKGGQANTFIGYGQQGPEHKTFRRLFAPP